MAKTLLPLLLSATLVVLLVTDAATISTTVEVEEECRQQHPMIDACQQYLYWSSQCSSSSYRSSKEGGDWREEFPRCCEQLEQIDEQCRCEAIKQVAQQQHQQLQGREMEEMLETAQSLPNLCRISPRRCDIQRREARY